MSMNQKIAVKARKPGISRTDWRRPISQPVNPAASLAKLLSSACQLAKLIQLRNVTVIRNATGEPKNRWRGMTGRADAVIRSFQAGADPPSFAHARGWVKCTILLICIMGWANRQGKVGRHRRCLMFRTILVPVDIDDVETSRPALD